MNEWCGNVLNLKVMINNEEWNKIITIYFPKNDILLIFSYFFKIWVNLNYRKTLKIKIISENFSFLNIGT